MKSKKFVFTIIFCLLTLSACGSKVVSHIGKQLNEKIVPPEVVEQMVVMLSRQIAQPESKIEIVELEQVDWPDSCLGSRLEDQTCEPVVTPGYRVVLQAKADQYEFRSNGDGSLIIRMTSAEEDPEGTPSTETATVEPTLSPRSMSEDKVSVPGGCYSVEFLGTENIDYETSVWRYRVEEEPCAQYMRNWVLELPACVQVVDADPFPWETAFPDPDIQLNGIRWETEPRFEQGEFLVVLSGDVAVGEVGFGIRGPEVGTSTISGPVCIVEPSPTSRPYIPVPTSTDKPSPPSNPKPTATTAATATAEPTETPVNTSVPVPTATPETRIVIGVSNQNVSRNCQGVNVLVMGNKNTISLSGTCLSLTVTGNNNTISLQSQPVNGISDQGNNNTIN